MADPRLPRHRLLLALGLALLPHVLHLAPWVSALFLAGLAWNALSLVREWPPPNRWWLAALATAGFAGVSLAFGSFTGRDAGVALLTLMTTLKLLEARDRRDYLLLTVLGYFLVLTLFLFDQGIPVTLYTFLPIFLLTAALGDLSAEQPRRYRHHLRTTGRLLVGALPLALVLFVIVPRPAGGLWGGTPDPGRGVTGLSERMAPGSVTDLAQSREPAFRVAFDDGIPASEDLYWRGPVFWHYDGRAWSPRDNRRWRRQPPGTPGATVDYTVTLEPHHRRWLFALDQPASIPAQAALTDDLQLLRDRDVHRRISYEASSHLDDTLAESLTALDRHHGLALPANGNPRLRQLANEWSERAVDDRDLLAIARRHFAEGPYRYTLQPPALGGENGMDRFLFTTREGYCEHYAAALVLLMRAAGVPARVVTGYQGGEYNAAGDFLLVRQSDAHAWAEVWLEGIGWRRVDPTTWISTARVEAGVERPGDAAAAVAAATDLAWTRRVGQLWDALDYRWTRWVLGFDFSLQRRLLERLHLPVHSLVLVAASTIALLLAFAAYRRWATRRPTPRPADELDRLFLRYCRRLERRGIARRAEEGPRALAERVARQHPELATRTRLVAELYTRLRYGRHADPATRRRLARLVRQRLPR